MRSERMHSRTRSLQILPPLLIPNPPLLQITRSHKVSNGAQEGIDQVTGGKIYSLNISNPEGKIIFDIQ